MITLLSVVGDSDVRPKHTEVGKGVPLTSPFIEEIYGAHIDGLTKRPYSTDLSARAHRVLGRDDTTTHPPGTRDACPTTEITVTKGGLWGSRRGCRVGGRLCQLRVRGR